MGKPHRLLTIALCVALSTVFGTPGAHAKRIYKYRDENGILHVTDREPETDRPVESRRVRVEPKRSVQIASEQDGNRIVYRADNRTFGPVEIGLTPERVSNAMTIPALPLSAVLPGRGVHELFTVRHVDPAKGLSFGVRAEVVPGAPRRSWDFNHAYRVPFEPGRAFTVSQGWHGIASHRDVQSRYAIDIAMPEGTVVVAARGGVVMDVDEDFFGAGTDDTFKDRANQVRILHDDGSMGVYAHLAEASVIVAPGERVPAGAKLALSGNTGYSSGPHLHFAVQINRGLSLQSVPFLFGSGPGAVKPANRGLRLRSPGPVSDRRPSSSLGDRR